MSDVRVTRPQHRDEVAEYMRVLSRALDRAGVRPGERFVVARANGEGPPDFGPRRFPRVKLVERLRLFTADAQWHTLAEAAGAVEGAEATVSAAFRELRNGPEYGYRVTKETRNGTVLYRVEPPDDMGPFGPDPDTGNLF